MNNSCAQNCDRSVSQLMHRDSQLLTMDSAIWIQ